MSARCIHKNVWDNWNGYIGRKKVIEFGTDAYAAREWVHRDIVGKFYRIMNHCDTGDAMLRVADRINFLLNYIPFRRER